MEEVEDSHGPKEERAVTEMFAKERLPEKEELKRVELATTMTSDMVKLEMYEGRKRGEFKRTELPVKVRARNEGQRAKGVSTKIGFVKITERDAQEDEHASDIPCEKLPMLPTCLEHCGDAMTAMRNESVANVLILHFTEYQISKTLFFIMWQAR